MLTGSKAARVRHGVGTCAAPRMTAGESLQTEQAPSPCAVGFHRVGKIMRARWLEPASAACSRENGEHRRYEYVIEANGKLNEPLHDFGRPAAARRTSERHSACRSANSASTAKCRATITSHAPGGSWSRPARTISRRRRRTRFRSTAPPTRRDVTIPTRASPDSAFWRILSNMNLPCEVTPSQRIR